MDGIASGVPLIARPSFDRACSLVTSEYVLAWEWFLREEQRGEIWEKLLHNIKADSPQYPYRMTIGSETFCVSRHAGIYWPGRGRIKHPVERPLRFRCITLQVGAIPMFPRSILRTARGCSSIHRKVLRSKTGATSATTKK